MRLRAVFGAGLLFPLLTASAADLPADAAIDAAAALKTLAPRVVVNSGRLEWEPYKRDLSGWPSLSHADRRPTPQTQRATLAGPGNGDPVRGRQIAMNPAQGNCIACHTLPDEDWPGSVGYLLLHYQRLGKSDAQVYQQIYDARALNPNTVMPPYGTFGLLDDQEIRDLVAYLQSLN